MNNEINPSQPSNPNRRFNRHKAIMAIGMSTLALLGAKDIAKHDYKVGVPAEVAAALAGTELLRKNGGQNSGPNTPLDGGGPEQPAPETSNPSQTQPPETHK